jgi:predicted DNA-binding protein YlxM (UPF0122 family)
MEKDFETVLLFDIYASLLTDKQQRLCDMYYNQDYSLAEIAEIEHTSRQAARDGIGKAKQKLKHLEQCLNISDKRSATIEAVERDDIQEIGRIWEK